MLDVKSEYTDSVGGLPGMIPTSANALPTAKNNARAISRMPKPVVIKNANGDTRTGAKPPLGESTVNGVAHSLQCKASSLFCLPQYRQAFMCSGATLSHDPTQPCRACDVNRECGTEASNRHWLQ